MAKRIGPVDARLRRWIRERVGKEQIPLGEAFRKAGLTPAGQPAVSRCINMTGAPVSLDHLLVVAEFFDWSLEEILVDVGALPPRGAEATPRLDRASVVKHLGELEERLRAILVSIQPPPPIAESADAPTKGGNTTPGSTPHRPGPKNKGR